MKSGEVPSHFGVEGSVVIANKRHVTSALGADYEATLVSRLDGEEKTLCPMPIAQRLFLTCS